MNAEDLNWVKDRSNPIVLDRKLCFIYFPNNKVAQSSINRKMLSHRAVIRKDNYWLWRWTFSRTKKKINKGTNIFSFTIVRNPFDLVVSAFFYLISRNHNHPIKYYQNFPNFCKSCLRYQGDNVDPHFLRQSDYLFKNGYLLPDFLGYFESLQEDWPKIASNIGEPKIELPHANRSIRNRNWRQYYDNECIEIVRDLYREDFRLLGYDIEP